MNPGGKRVGAGAQRLPDEVKKARGTYRPDRANPSAVRLAAAPIPPPPATGLRPDECAWWSVLERAVAAVGVYTAADEVAFRTLVRTQALLERAHAGEVVGVGRDGNAEYGTKVSDIVALTRTLTGLLTRFGLDPSSRDKLVAAPNPEDGPAPADPDAFEPIQ